jgi:hypothetical protein
VWEDLGMLSAGVLLTSEAKAAIFPSIQQWGFPIIRQENEAFFLQSAAYVKWYQLK